MADPQKPKEQPQKSKETQRPAERNIDRRKLSRPAKTKKEG